MLTLGIRYLTGCVVASDVADRDSVEWPPHPGRVFMALAAAHFQTGEDAAERTALEWLEALSPPEMFVPEHSARTPVKHFVPVNDDNEGFKKKPDGSVTMRTEFANGIGIRRNRQDRTFACAWLVDDTVYLHWPSAHAADYLAALENLAGKVTRIGHSISLVQCWFSSAAPVAPTNWLPDSVAPEIRLRTSSTGVLGELGRRFNAIAIERYFTLKSEALDSSDKKRQKAAEEALNAEFQDTEPVRLRPALSLAHGYSRRPDETANEAAGTVFDPRLMVFALERIDGPLRFLDSVATLQVTTRLREALLAHLGKDGGGLVPEELAGHGSSGPAQLPHLAYLPLPFVDHEHAHGGLLGLAIAVPRTLPVEMRQRLLHAVAALRADRADGLLLGALGRWRLVAPDGASPAGVREQTWTASPGGSLRWATVTPYVYDRHPKAKEKAAYLDEVAAAVRLSWTRVQCASPLQPPPELVEVYVTPVAKHLGVPAAHEFPRMKRKDGSQCRHAHLVLTFDRPVVGPVLLGTGRYFGYGFCRPVANN
jgi:CRISPR-associated protein Csb2